MLTFRDWVRRYNFSRQSTVLRCSRARLIDLDGIEWFEDLEYLDCARNELRFIPDLRRLKRLRILDISHNQIEQLPGLPNTLTSLDCSFNPMRQINFDQPLPWLQQLLCSACRITGITGLTQSPLTLLDCRNNALTKMPKAPGSLIHALFEGNPIEEEETDEETS